VDFWEVQASTTRNISKRASSMKMISMSEKTLNCDHSQMESAKSASALAP
jgi:hypothetical protein